MTTLPTSVLTSLRRRDQRRRGADYVRGLLGTEGRKTIRRVAATVAGPEPVTATEQRLHHFVCDSTWDWTPVRRELAAHVTSRREAGPPWAWVVHRSVLPRTGDQAAGTCRRYQPELGRTATAQLAAGLWAAGMDGADPLDWVLHVPSPGGALDQDVVTAAARAPDHGRPVVVDARGLDVAGLLAALTDPSGPVAPVRPAVVGVPEDLVLHPHEPAPGSRSPRPAVELLRGAHRRPTRPVRHRGRPTVLGELAVRRPGDPPSGGWLRLVGAGPDGASWPARTWLTTLEGAAPADVAALGRLTHVVARDAGALGEQVGLHDFVGRSYAGWHRHMTMASIAYAIRAEELRPADTARRDGRPFPVTTVATTTTAPEPTWARVG